MPKIVINTSNGLNTSHEKGLHVKIDSAAGNRLHLNDDGLAVSPSSDEDTMTLSENQIGYGIQLDWSPFGTFQKMFFSDISSAEYLEYIASFKDKISCNSSVHRTWTAAGLSPDTNMPYGLSGKNTSDPYQESSDWIFVGDFVRVPKENGKYDYYLITQVSSHEGKPGNEIIGIVLLLENGDDY